LRVGLERPKSFDPALASPGSESELVVADLLFDGLTTAPAGETAVAGALAARWAPSADMRAWTFTLRSDARFSNGRAVGALDVKYTLERVAKQGAGSLSALRLELITGWSDLVAGKAADLPGIKAIDGVTVEIDLDAPFAALPELLASPVYGIVPQEAVEAAAPAFGSAPVGSGPFAYASATSDAVTLRRATGSTALLDGVDLQLYDDVAKSYDDFVAGRLDWSPVPTAKVGDAEGRYGSGAFRPFHAELFYAFNALDPALSDVRFRQAIVKSIDRAAIVKAVYPDIAELLNGLVPDGVPGHRADACGTPCAYDVNAARALLAAAFPDGAIPTVHLDYATGAAADSVAGAMETSLTAAGIPVQKRPLAPDAYDAFAGSGQEGLFQFGWIAVYPDPDAYLATLFATGSRDNATGFSNADVDALLATARATVDPATRLTTYQNAETAILAQTPIVPLAQLLTKVVLSPGVQDLALAVGGTFAAEKVWLDR